MVVAVRFGCSGVIWLQRCNLVVAVRTLSAIAGVTRTSGSADRTLAFAGRCRTPWSCQKGTGSRKYEHDTRRSCGRHGEGATGWLLVAFGHNWLHAACCIMHGACCIMQGACCRCVVGFMSHVVCVAMVHVVAAKRMLHHVPGASARAPPARSTPRGRPRPAHSEWHRLLQVANKHPNAR